MALNGRMAGADLFDQPRTAAVLWSKLVRSYALDALDGHPGAPVSRDRAVNLLERPEKATFEAFPSLALGEDVRFAGNGVTGASLVYQGTAVHLSLFRDQDQASSGAGSEGIVRASLRRAFRRSPHQTA